VRGEKRARICGTWPYSNLAEKGKRCGIRGEREGRYAKASFMNNEEQKKNPHEFAHGRAQNEKRAQKAEQLTQRKPYRSTKKRCAQGRKKGKVGGGGSNRSLRSKRAIRKMYSLKSNLLFKAGSRSPDVPDREGEELTNNPNPCWPRFK